ncbi:MAG: EAL domain-containing response regulator [Enterobacterales bacterium]|nr:EAL domain-containing response regulator [Enterobacterales bacterium]
MAEVFIIDDDSQTVEMLAEVVSMTGFESRNYLDANLFFQENKFNDQSIILLDLNMPNMDGVEVIRELSNHKCRASLILMSGYDMGVLHSAEKLALEHGLQIIKSLTKPINLTELMTSLISQQSKAKVSRSRNIIDFQPTPEELSEAMHDDQLLLHYQPQVDVTKGIIRGAEALVRWQHPIHGLLPPITFISLAEEYGLMDELTFIVLDKSLKQLVNLHKYDHYFPVSVNVSAESIKSIRLPEIISEKLQENNLQPKDLTLEVTESVLMGELVTSLDILTRLRMRGFSLSIDDFGTGFSSLSMLHKIPFNELKVDSSFVMQMTKDADAFAIVKTCVVLAKELNMQVVAEGVETQEIHDKLSDLGCNIAQGYHIARPIPATDFMDWLSEH